MKRLSIIFLLLSLVACANAAPTPTVTPLPPATLTAVPTATLTATVEPSPTSTPQPTTTPVPTTPAPPTAAPTIAPAPAVDLPAVAGITANTTAAWQAFVNTILASDAATQQTLVDQFWQAVTAAHRVPLILDDNVVFFYKGDALSVMWLGDFSFWTTQGGVNGQRLGSTDLWYGQANLPRDSRADYQIFLDQSTDGILDSANPRARDSGSGTNSVLVMPQFQVTDETHKRTGVPAGNLTDWTTLNSQAYGAPVNYRVYTPPGYAALQKLPVLYVTDGDRFSNPSIGAIQVALDNLLAEQRIQPVMAVFIDARDPNPPHADLRNQQLLNNPLGFGKFIVTELIPAMDAQYHTDATPAGRAILGASFGAAFSTYEALEYPQVFGKLVVMSPAYWVFGAPGAEQPQTPGAAHMNTAIQAALKCKSSKTIACPAAPLQVFMSIGESGWDVADFSSTINALQARGDNVTLMHVSEGHNWGTWAGEMDEMLTFFWGTSN